MGTTSIKVGDGQEKQGAQDEDLLELETLESTETTAYEKGDNIEESKVAPTPLSEVVKTKVPAIVDQREPEYHPSRDDANSHRAKRFLVAYLTSIFSALSLLSGTSFLVYVLLNHFLGEKSERSWLSLDLAPLYVAVMASTLVFAALYMVSTWYVARSAVRDEIGLRDWRVYKVIYSFFSALLLIVAALVISGLLYIPLAQLLISEDVSARQGIIQAIGGLYVLALTALLVWQERVVKNGRHTKLQGITVVLIAFVVVVLMVLFPIAARADQRHDYRTESDLSAIQTEVERYKIDHKGALPATLAELTFPDDSPIKQRIDGYTYTIKSSPMPAGGSSQTHLKSLQPTSGTNSLPSPFNPLVPSRVSAQVSEKTYDLCATFRTDTSENANDSVNPLAAIATVGSNSQQYESHKSGEVCFTHS